MEKIIIEKYNPQWAEAFGAIKAVFEEELKHIDVTIEHVGSTSVPGLRAKPILDMVIVLEDHADMRAVIDIVETLGYKHNGDQGIKGREAFKMLDDKVPYGIESFYPFKQHLYACHKDVLAYKNFVILKNHLLSHPKDCEAYGQLKEKLSIKYADDRLAYTEAKSEFILSILGNYEMDNEALDAIRKMNDTKAIRN